MSIYQARRNEEGILHDPEPFALELIFRLHEGPVSFDRTAEKVYFTKNDNQNVAPDGFRKLQIYSADKVDGEWVNIQKPSFNLANYNFCHPSLSVNGDVLFMASDMPGGFGGMDLYAVYFQDSTWADIVNLGGEVNTAANEVFPFSSADGTLYFASDREGGSGKLDLYYTKTWGEKWRKPVNLGKPFNTEADDFGLIVDSENKNGYFSSNRIGGFGHDDIYSFYVEGFGSSIAGKGFRLDGLTVLDEKGKPIDGATLSAIQMEEITLSAGAESGVRLIPGEDGNFILNSGNDSLIYSTLTLPDGSVDAELNPGNYIVKIAKEGYLPEFLVITPETDLNALRLRLKKAEDCVALKGKVLMKNGGRPISGATIEIVNVATRKTELIYSDENGNYEYCLRCGATYALFSHKNGSASSIAVVTTKGLACDSTDILEIPLFMVGADLYAGMTITLPNIYFNFDDSSLRPDAYPDLDEVYGMLTSYPNMKLELASHTDSRGSYTYNQDLSSRRSESVFKYLVSKGIDAIRLTKRGYGESQIRNRCKDGVNCNEDEHRYNRRTEIKIIFLGNDSKSDLIGRLSLEDVRKELQIRAMLGKTANPLESEKGGQEMGEDFSEEVVPPHPLVGAIGVTYTVIAGTFSSKENAEKRVQLLQAKGHVMSQIIQREGKELFAVIVQSFSTEKDARQLVGKLASQMVEAYVLKTRN
jgi:outer membrane protein OmpA-like peptidoglycan-associated protein